MEATPQVVLRRDISGKLLRDISQKFSLEEQCTGLAVYLFDGLSTVGHDFVRSRVERGASYTKIAHDTLHEWCLLKSWEAKGRYLYGVLNMIGMNDTADDFHLRLTKLTAGMNEISPNLDQLGVNVLD